MKADISTKNRKALSIPQKGSVHKSAILLESKCKKESDDTISYQFLFKRTAKRPDLLAVLSMFSKGTHINLDDGDYVIENHDYTIKTLKKGIKVSGGFSMAPLALSNPHVKQLTALEDFNHEYSKMEMIQPDTYFRVYPYQNFNGPAFRAKLFSYVSNMGENYGYCDSGSLYYRRASLVMPKIKITKAIPQAKMMFHTHPKKDEPSLSSPDDFLLYFDLSHKPRNIRHFYTVMADRMDYFHITPKHDKKNDYVKIDEDKFIEKLDKKMDEIAKICDEKLPSKTDADNLYYCERITKDVVKWLNKEYSRYFKIKYKCHYRVKKNPDKDTGESLHLGDAFLAKALNDIKAGDYTWPEFEIDTLPHEKYAYWYSLYHGMRMDRSGIGFSRVVSLQPGDSRRLDYFGLKRFESTQFDYFDIINILLLNYDISMADAKVRDGKGTTSRITEILDFLELEDEKSREDLVLLTQVLESGIYSDEARTLAGDHYFILPIIESCVLALQAIEEVNSKANMKLTPKEQKVVYELKKYELILHSEKAGAATAAALGDLYNKTFAGTPKSLRPNPPLSKKQMQYSGHLPKHSMANVGLLSDVLKEFAPSRLDMPQNYETERGQLSLRVKAEEEIVTIKLTPSSGNMQIFSHSDEAAIEAVRKVIEVLKPHIDFRPEDDIDNIGVITNEPVRNPKNAIIISVASPIQKTKNEVLTSLEKRLRDSTIATTYTTRILREYEKRPHLVEVSDDMYNRLVSNGDIIMGISYGDSERRGYKRSDFEKSKYVLVDTMVRDQDLLSRADSSIISFYLHPTNTKGNVEKYLQNYVSPQEAKKVTSLLDYLKDMASGDTFDHVIDYDINKPSFVIEEVFKEVPKSNPKGPDPLGQTIFGDGSRYLSAQTIPITALQNIRTGVLAATIAGPPLLNPKQPSVITISGPSGSGKSTILKKISKITGAVMIPTVTTRERRPKEQLGQDRIFVTKEEFQTMIANGEFVEWKKLKNGHYYGRRYSDFKDISIVDVSLKGMKDYKKKFFNTFSIFLKPNVSAEVLASHMRKRGGMSESERKGRADIIGKLLESASKMDFDLVVTSRVGEYEKVAEEIVPQLPQSNPKKYKGKASVVISRSTKKDKKLMAVFNFPDGRKKTTHFGGKGYSDYTIHNDKDRKKRYDTRHSSREDWEDFTTAGALSKWILWNKPSLMDSFNHYKAMFSLDGAITVQTSQAGKIPASRNPPDFEFSRNKDKRKKRWDFVTKSPPRDLYRKAMKLADEKKVFFETQEVALKEPFVRNVPANIRDDFLDWYYNHTKNITFWLGSKKGGDQIATLERYVILKPVPTSIVEFVNNYDTKHRSRKTAPKLGKITRYSLHRGKLLPRSAFGVGYFGPTSPPKSSYPIMLDDGGGIVEEKSQFKGYYGIVKLLEAYYMETNGIEGYGMGTSLQRAEYYRSFGWLMPQDMKYAPYIHKGPRKYLKLEEDELGWDSSMHHLWRPVYSKTKKNPPILTPSTLRKEPNTLFVFGDNDLREGKGGQAVNRDEPNAIGIRTKHKPTTNADAYYTDDNYTDNIRKMQVDLNNIKRLSANYESVYFMQGIGDGRAKLEEKAPKTYAWLKNNLPKENPPVKLVSRTGTDDNVSRFFNKESGEELTGKVFDSATMDTKDGTSLEVGEEMDPVELVGIKRQYNVAKLNDRTVIQVGNGTNRVFEKIDFKLPVHLEYDPMSLGEPSAYITTRGVLIFDKGEDNYTLVKRNEITDFKGVSKTDSSLLVPLYKYAKVVKRTPGRHGGPVENPFGFLTGPKKPCPKPLKKGITIYGASRCHWCGEAKIYLDKKGKKYKYVDIDKVKDYHKTIGPLTNNYKYIPAIFIAGKFIGGYDKLVGKKNPMAPGYQSYSWTTEDWRSIKVNNKGEIDYKEKCGAEGTQTPDGSPRLCLPAEVIRSLLRTESGKDVIRTQARKKARAKKGERVPWHPRIKKIWKRVKEQSPKDKENPNHIKISHYPDPDPEAEEGMMRIDLHEGGDNVGFLQWKELDDVVHINYLKVKKSHRRNGLGKLLLDEFGKMHKGKKIQLSAPLGQSRDWIPEWYQRYGFKLVESDSNLMALQNPGWRHGEQMEDDPFAEYFEENVEGDENVSEE